MVPDKLDVVTDTDLGHTRHGAGIRIGQPDLFLAGLVQFIRQRLIPLAFDRGYLFREIAIAAAGTAIVAGFLLLHIAFIERLYIIGQFLVGFVYEFRESAPGEVAILVVHRLDARAIYRQQFPPHKVELSAQDDKFPEHLFEGRPVHTAKIGDGAEVGLQVPQQPDHFDVAMGLCLQPPAGSAA